MKTRYLLVQWPESQSFIGHPECHLCECDEDDPLELDCAYFVPEEVYNEIMNNYENSNSRS